MSCGFALPELALPIPAVSLPRLPSLPDLPDFSFAADLGIDFTLPPLDLPIPEVSLPKLPTLPELGTLPCPFDDEV